jgi:threonine aldolase
MIQSIELRSDNAAGVAPEILRAVSAANSGSALAYGADPWTERLQARVAEVFENADAAVFPVLTGTAANAIALSAMAPPWGAVLCHETAHILRSEAGATSMFGAGLVMQGLPGEQFKLSPESLAQGFDTTRWGDPHHSQPGVVSLTNPTDMGTVYTVEQIRVLTTQARERGLLVHMDGARVANALATLGCSPADLTWRAGVDVFSLGATKNGVMTADAIVSFDKEVNEQLTYRLKRAGQVASKMRFQSAQLLAYLEDDLWLSLAQHANRAMRKLSMGLQELGIDLVAEPEANMAFLKVSNNIADRLADQGLLFYQTAPGVIRFVTSFSTQDADIEEVLRRVKHVVNS